MSARHAHRFCFAATLAVGGALVQGCFPETDLDDLDYGPDDVPPAGTDDVDDTGLTGDTGAPLDTGAGSDDGEDTGAVDPVDTGEHDTGDSHTGYPGEEYNGSYVGFVEISASETILGLSDSCSGTITVTVDGESSMQIDGAGTCTWSTGLLSSTSTSLELEGKFVERGGTEAAGTLQWEAFGEQFSTDWSGSFEDDGFQASFSDTQDGNVWGFYVPVAYEGAFAVAR